MTRTLCKLLNLDGGGSSPKTAWDIFALLKRFCTICTKKERHLCILVESTEPRYLEGKHTGSICLMPFPVFLQKWTKYSGHCVFVKCICNLHLLIKKLCFSIKKVYDICVLQCNSLGPKYDQNRTKVWSELLIKTRYVHNNFYKNSVGSQNKTTFRPDTYCSL